MEIPEVFQFSPTTPPELISVNPPLLPYLDPSLETTNPPLGSSSPSLAYSELKTFAPPELASTSNTPLESNTGVNTQSLDSDWLIGETGTVNNFNENNQTITLDRSYNNPVIFAHPLSYNGSDPSMVRITDITSNSFTAFLEEPNHLDGSHTTESFSYMVLEAGTWELADGTLIEVGTLNTDTVVQQGWDTINFQTNFASTPIVLSQVQTNNGGDFVRPRHRNLGNGSFQLALEEEEANLNTNHITETVGYFAISTGSGTWNGKAYQAGKTPNQVTDGWYDLSFGTSFSQSPNFLASLASYDGIDPAGLRYRNLNNNSVQIKVEEDTSLDSETTHTTEVVDFFAIDGDGFLTANPIIGETGTVSSFDETSQTINLDRSYNNPVIFAHPLSYNGSDPSMVRITDVTSNSFTAFLEEPNHLDGSHTLESFSYMVLEAGTWELADGTIIEVGTVDTDTVVQQGWDTVSFQAFFESNPAVLSQVQTNNGSDFVRPRHRQVSNSSFQLALEEEEANLNTNHVTETIGYFATSTGSGTWNGKAYQAGKTPNQVTDGWYDLSFGTSFSQSPNFLASLASYDGIDPAGLRYRNLNSGSVQLKVEEDTSLDSETTHTTEIVDFFAIDGDGFLTGQSLTPTSTFDIQFDYRFDTRGWFTSERREALEVAAEIWESLILDEFADTPIGTDTPFVKNPETGENVGTDDIFTTDVPIDDLLVFVGARDLGGTTLGRAGASGWYTNETRYVGDDFEPWIGSATFDVDSNWFFDPTPTTADDIPSGSNDFIAVAVHEIGHILGFSDGINAFGNLVDNGTFIGSNATSYNGGSPVPLESDNTHIQDGYEYGGTGENLMDPTVTVGTRKLPTVLDAAFLADIGYEINYNATYQNA